MRYALFALGTAMLLVGCLHRPPGSTSTSESVAPPTPPVPPAAGLAIGLVRADGTYCLYHPDSGTVEELFPGLAGGLGYSADATRVACQDAQGTIWLADLRTRELKELGRTDRAQVFSIAISPDGAKVAWADETALRVWSEGQVITVPGPDHPNQPAWSPQGTRLAMGARRGANDGQDDGVWVWEGSGAAQRLVPPAEGKGAVGRILWSPDGKWLAWERRTGDAVTGDLGRSDGTQLRRDELAASPIQWLPDASGLLVAVPVKAGVSSVGLYRLAERKVVPLGPEQAGTVAALSPDGNEVLVFGPGNEARLINLAAPATSARWEAPGQVELCHWGENDQLVFAARRAPGERLSIYVSPPMGPAQQLSLEPYQPVQGLRWLRVSP